MLGPRLGCPTPRRRERRRAMGRSVVQPEVDVDHLHPAVTGAPRSRTRTPASDRRVSTTLGLGSMVRRWTHVRQDHPSTRDLHHRHAHSFGRLVPLRRSTARPGSGVARRPATRRRRLELRIDPLRVRRRLVSHLDHGPQALSAYQLSGRTIGVADALRRGRESRRARRRDGTWPMYRPYPAGIGSGSSHRVPAGGRRSGPAGAEVGERYPGEPEASAGSLRA